MLRQSPVNVFGSIFFFLCNYKCINDKCRAIVTMSLDSCFPPDLDRAKFTISSMHISMNLVLRILAIWRLWLKSLLLFFNYHLLEPLQIFIILCIRTCLNIVSVYHKVLYLSPIHAIRTLT